MRDKSAKKQEKELEKKALELEKKLALKMLAQKESEDKENAENEQVDALEKESINIDNMADNALRASDEEISVAKEQEIAEQELAEQEHETEQKEAVELKDEATSARVQKIGFTRSKKHSSEIDMEDIVDYCDYIEATAKKLNSHTARTAGGWGEKRGARMLRELSQASLLAPSRLEPVDSRFLRGRGSFFVLGVWYAICLVLYLASFSMPNAGGVIMTAVTLFLFIAGVVVILSLILGFQWFKKLYPKKVSYNVVSVLEPKSEVRRTVIVSCNYDSPLGNNFETKVNIMPSIMLGALISLVLFVVFCIIKMSVVPDVPSEIVGLTVLPILLSVVAIAALVGYISLSKKRVKDGNGLGVSTTLATVKYFVDKDMIPSDCKVIFVAFSADNAGHGGAEEFVELHKKEENFFVNPVAINFGEILDETLTVVSKDAIHAQSYDSELVSLCVEAAKEQGMPIDNFSGYINSIYGFASTPFAKNGIPSATILSKDLKINPLKAAQVQNVNRNIIENNFKAAIATIEKILGE